MIILGLGSNIGERFGYLSAAVARIAPFLTGMKLSRVLESASLGPGGVIGEGPSFLNMAISGETPLAPLALLDELKRIERELGRLERGYWGSREIDIDILAVDGLVLNEARLVVPHAHMLDRDFVMLPLMDVAPDWRYPGSCEWHGMTPAEIVRRKGFALNGNLKETGLTFA